MFLAWIPSFGVYYGFHRKNKVCGVRNISIAENSLRLRSKLENALDAQQSYFPNVRKDT